MIVYLSGNNGSGKTTLGRALARSLGWQHLPAQKFDVSYLNDLFERQKRWSFEAQTHFLLFKANLVQRAAAEMIHAFIDRSPYEDAQIFARYFYERGKMDRRSYRTYQDLYRLILPGLPAPDAFIYCYCPPQVLRDRVAGRGRQYEENYPKGHLQLLDAYYCHWIEAASKAFPGKIFMVDTTQVDFRNNDAAVQQVADELQFWLDQSNRASPGQLSMFLNPEPDQESLFAKEPKTPVLLRPAKLNDREVRLRPNRLTGYIAAPFTGKTALPYNVPVDSAENDSQPMLEYTRQAPHGRITDQEYREFLLEIERVAQSVGFATILPHRDVNAWGDRLLEPGEAMIGCTRSVLSSDVVIALPEKSFGVHYEVGIAVGYGIPVVQLQRYSAGQTFIADGLRQLSGVTFISFSSLDDLRPQLSAALTEVVSRAEG